MVGIRVNARVEFVRDVVGVVTDIGRTCGGATVVHVGVKARIELIGSVGAV